MVGIIRTCDFHRKEQRHFLKRDKKFKVIENEIDKEAYFDSFKLFDTEEKEKDTYLNSNSYELQLLDEIFNEDVLKENSSNNNNNNNNSEDNNNFILIKEEEEEAFNSNDMFPLNEYKANSEEEIKNELEEIKIKNKNNKKLIDIIILKNILNLYFLFDDKNYGYIDLKYASHVIQNVYQNNINFLTEHIKLNENELNKNKSNLNNKKIEINQNFCTKYFANFLLVILKDISVFLKKDGILSKENFIEIMHQYIKTNNYLNNVYGIFKYPKNIITDFYNYVDYIKATADEKKIKNMKNTKKKKKLKSLFFFDEQLVNANLHTHINYFKEKKNKKLENIKKESSIKEMEECTFLPYTTKKPSYLLKRKVENNMNKIIKESNVKKKYTKSEIVYDIDNSIERKLILPNNVILKKIDKSFENLYSENNKSIKLKYIIHQGYEKPKKISWNDTLRNKKINSVQELINNEETKKYIIKNNKNMIKKEQNTNEKNIKKDDDSIATKKRSVNNIFKNRIHINNKNIIDPLIINSNKIFTT